MAVSTAHWKVGELVLVHELFPGVRITEMEIEIIIGSSLGRNTQLWYYFSSTFYLE